MDENEATFKISKDRLEWIDTTYKYDPLLIKYTQLILSKNDSTCAPFEVKVPEKTVIDYSKPNPVAERLYGDERLTRQFFYWVSGGNGRLYLGCGNIEKVMKTLANSGFQEEIGRRTRGESLEIRVANKKGTAIATVEVATKTPLRELWFDTLGRGAKRMVCLFYESNRTRKPDFLNWIYITTEISKYPQEDNFTPIENAGRDKWSVQTFEQTNSRDRLSREIESHLLKSFLNDGFKFIVTGKNYGATPNFYVNLQ